MSFSSTQANSEVISLSVTLDPANPSQARLLDTLCQAGYYDPAAQNQSACDELIRVLLGQYLHVFPWWTDSGTGRSPQLPARTLRNVSSGDKITPDFCPPTWGGRR